MLRTVGGTALGTATARLTAVTPPVQGTEIADTVAFWRNGNQYQAIHDAAASYGLLQFPTYERFEVRHGDHASADVSTSERSEANSFTRRAFGTDIWLAMSQRLHRTAPTADVANAGEGWIILGQFWATPDAGEFSSRSPAMAFQLLHNEFQIVTRSDWAAASTGNAVGTVRYSDSSPPFDTWVNWVVKVRFEQTVNGSLEVWRNGTKVIDETSIPIGYNDLLGHRWQYGVYRQTDSSHATFVAEYANVEVGTADLSARVASPLPVPA